MLPPEDVRAIASGLLDRGYARGDVRKILGGNFLRIAQSTWPKSTRCDGTLDS